MSQQMPNSNTFKPFDSNDKKKLKELSIPEASKPQKDFEEAFTESGHLPDNMLSKETKTVSPLENERKEQELNFIDISSKYPYRESVIRASLFKIKDKAIAYGCSITFSDLNNITIDNKETFEIIIKAIAKFTHDKKGFDEVLGIFFENIKKQLYESEYKTELQAIIKDAIKTTSKFICKTNSQSAYGALCVEHMKHIFKNIIKVSGGLFCLKERKYITDNKSFDNIYSRSGQEFILNVRYGTKEKRNETIEYYKINTTTSAYKAIIEAEFSDDAVKRCDKIVNNPHKEYGFYTESNEKCFNIFIKPNVKKIDWTTDKKGVERFLKIHKEQYTNADYEALLNWLAQIAQNPFRKLGYAPFVQGTHGSGKSTLTHNIPHYCITGLRLTIDQHPIKDKYCQLIEANTFTEKTNPYMRDCFFMIISEVKDFTIKDMNALKEKITGHQLTINQHYKNPEFIDNKINFAFASNYRNGLKIEANERRYLPIFSKFQSKYNLIDAGYMDNISQKSSYFNEIYEWLENKDGYAKIYDYLLKRDVSQVSTRNAPITDSMQDAVKASHDQYTSILSDYGDDLPAVITACQAADLIQRKDQSCRSVKRIAKALTNLEYEKHPLMHHVTRIRYNKKRYTIYVKSNSGYKNETDKDIICSIAENLYKELTE